MHNSLEENYDKTLLEVVKTNDYARRFYEREGFVEKEDRGEKLLLVKHYKKCE